MSAKSGDQGERRTRTQQMIKKLLAERQEMLVLFCRVAGLEPFSPDDAVKQHLQEFCQVLMDYTAFGHFEIYQRIVDGTERRHQVIRIAEKIYPRIAETTEESVAFNDRYDTSERDPSLQDLSADLSRLGAQLANRIELEDQLIGVMLAR